MPPNLQTPSPRDSPLIVEHDTTNVKVFRCAILGCGMMGQEHVSYLMGYPNQTRLDFLCDPHEPSLTKCLQVMKEFQQPKTIVTSSINNGHYFSDSMVKLPKLFNDENELLQHAHEIDLLIIASPNYLHTPQLLKWSRYEHLTILCEKPVAVSYEQLLRLQDMQPKAKIWIAMEYRFIPAVQQLLMLLPTVGEVQMVTIRENRYPFLNKIGNWNRDRSKTGDTLVEKCCHFFDLFRLITRKEANLSHVRALAQRGLNYEAEVDDQHDVPILDSAYVTLPFVPPQNGSDRSKSKVNTIGCLELCMYAEGSRHQEEIIVTGTRGRLEAYLPENKVYQYQRPSHDEWADRSVPPPKHVKREIVYDCSDVRSVHGIDQTIPTHGGYHYSSTAVEWYRLLQAMTTCQENGTWTPLVSLEDGMRAVEIGLQATQSIVNELADGALAL
ncbi:hypothetical protein MPSEU_000783900 [Mayamaea pseudoterrestris]|nr:hypothetical protein MPSEU_000783900 [Mayamaea pseudoterrestris]